MQPLREQIYSQLQQEGTYSLDSLAHQYRTSKPVIELQLQRLQEEGKKIKVTDEEVCIFLDHSHKIWPYAFWLFFGLIFTLLGIGVFDG
jgi:DeoR/GlpR family transcriptional regulator of sugar metabolism